MKRKSIDFFYILVYNLFSATLEKLLLIIDDNFSFVDERYDKGFQVSVSIDGITADRKLVSVLPPEAGHNRYEYFFDY